MLAMTLAKGNHKSALTKEAEETVDKLLHTETELGYMIPITKSTIKQLKGAEVYPLGLQHQMTINELGEQTPKKRVTHDLSNRKASGRSINQRIDEAKVPDTMYGHALRRFAHLIHHLRSQHPNTPILMAKSDFDKAYCRLHTCPRITTKCIATWHTKPDSPDKPPSFIGAMLTRLPFGSSPAPPEFSICSETIFDLAGDLLRCPYWDPENLPAPHAKLLQKPNRLPTSVPFGKAQPADVSLPPSMKGGVDGYLDDGAIAVLDAEENKRMVKRASQALQMATHLVFRPTSLDEPLPRPDAQSIRKLKAEGRLSEVFTLLGWKIDSRALTISLTKDKATAWRRSLLEVLENLTVQFKHIETIVGRLNHVGYTIPTARHFLNRIRRLQLIAGRHGRAMITQRARKDLQLWITFLHKAEQGISINSIVYRKPTTLTFSDACGYGMGGYSLTTGIAWRHEFTKTERETFTLNTKEFIASVINGMINLPLDRNPSPCLLSAGDSSSTVGWMHKSNFDPAGEPIHDEIARKHAHTVMKHKACDYSQHIPGVTNIIADSLSRDFHLSNKKLTAMLHDAKPLYSPQKIKLIPLDPTITSWIGSLAQDKPKLKVLPERRTQSTVAAGVCGWDSKKNAASPTPIWTKPATKNALTTSPDSCTQCDVADLAEIIPEYQVARQGRPLDTWFRPLQKVVGQTHFKQKQGEQPLPSNDN